MRRVVYLKRASASHQTHLQGRKFAKGPALAFRPKLRILPPTSRKLRLVRVSEAPGMLKIGWFGRAIAAGIIPRPMQLIGAPNATRSKKDGAAAVAAEARFAMKTVAEVVGSRSRPANKTGPTHDRTQVPAPGIKQRI